MIRQISEILAVQMKNTYVYFYSNIFQIGYALQKGLIPLNAGSFIKALKLNNVKVQENINAFNWGRLAANDLKYVLKKLDIGDFTKKNIDIDELLNIRYEELIKYQSKKYADIFLDKINKTRNKLNKLDIKNEFYIKNVIKYLYKTMAYKDEYEVARLFTDGRFKKELEKNFKSFDKIYLHLSPPFLGLKDKFTSLPKKVKVTSKILFIFKILKNLKFLRGTIFDPFSFTLERKLEKDLIKNFFKTLDYLNNKMNKYNYYEADQVIQAFAIVRGYGHIKLANFKSFEIELRRRLESFKKSSDKRTKIAAE